MPFVIKHKETGELYTGDNAKAVKYYASRGAASGALTNCVVNGRRSRQMIGMDYNELNALANEGLLPTLAEINDAAEAYRRAQYDFNGDYSKSKPFGEALWRLRRDRNDAYMKRRRDIIHERQMWEVAEV